MTNKFCQLSHQRTPAPYHH